jgi:hypothetical protein
MDVDEFNRQQSLRQFPPERRWETVEGALLQPRSKRDSLPLVSIAGRDHKGAEVTFWIDPPNAMYLLNFLAHIQRETGATVPSAPPKASEPFDGRV